MLAATAFVAAGAGASGHTTLRGMIPLPPPGGERIDLLTIRVTAKHGAPPNSLTIRTTNDGQLPDAIRAAAGQTRPVTKGRTSRFKVLVVINDITGKTAQVVAAQHGSLDADIEFAKGDLQTAINDRILGASNCPEIRRLRRHLRELVRLRSRTREPSKPPEVIDKTIRFVCH